MGGHWIPARVTAMWTTLGTMWDFGTTCPVGRAWEALLVERLIRRDECVHAHKAGEHAMWNAPPARQYTVRPYGEVQRAANGKPILVVAAFPPSAST